MNNPQTSQVVNNASERLRDFLGFLSTLDDEERAAFLRHLENGFKVVHPLSVEVVSGVRNAVRGTL